MKTLKELTLLSKFLFDETMDIPEAHQAALRIILGDPKLSLLTPAQTEKELRTAPWLRSIRLDVFSLDEERTVYNTEMQKEWRSDLIRRSRYYQGLIDSSLPELGTISFNALNDTCIIMITPFDLFGLDKYCYTFRYCCEEDQSLTLGDGATRIFLNTRGKNNQEVREELVHFLHYLEHTDDASAACSGSENIQVIHECVKKIKASEEAGVKYMQAWEEKILEREKGRSEGLEQGIQAFILEQSGRKRSKGTHPLQTNEAICTNRCAGRSILPEIFIQIKNRRLLHSMQQPPSFYSSFINFFLCFFFSLFSLPSHRL